MWLAHTRMTDSRSTPRVTAVIPCYNYGRFLSDAVTSVLAQTGADTDILVVDDGSTDQETIQLLDTAQWPRTQILRLPNQGVMKARNAGIAQATGEYILMMDADDVVDPGYIPSCIEALTLHQDAGFAYGDIRTFGLESWISRTPDRVRLSRILWDNPLPATAVFRRTALQSVGAYDETLTGHEDWELFIRLVAHGYPGIRASEVTSGYRKHGPSQVDRYAARHFTLTQEVRERHPHLYRDPKTLEALRKAEGTPRWFRFWAWLKYITFKPGIRVVRRWIKQLWIRLFAQTHRP